MLLQKVNNESGGPGSGGFLKVVFFLLLLGLAYLAGYYERGKGLARESTPDAVPVETAASTPAAETPAEDAAAVPVTPSTPAAMPTAATPTPALIDATATATPVRVEKAVAVAPPPSTAAPAPAPTPAAAPVKQANQVTVTEPVEIPVKDDSGKVTGYINLQRGQFITPISVDHDQIKIKSGSGFVMVPISSTDMAH